MTLKRSRVPDNGELTATNSPAPAAPEQATNPPTSRIIAEPAPEAERIQPHAGGRLIVPTVDIELDDEQEIEDETTCEKLTICNPARNMWIVLDRSNWVKAKLLKFQPESPDKPNQRSQKAKWFYVDEPLQQKIKSELCYAWVLPFLSVETNICRLWAIRVTTGNSWFETLHTKILSKPAEFFTDFEFNIQAREINHRVKRRPRTHNPPWPNKSTNVLLSEALGENIIATADHPFYASLIDGEEVT
jgi:hypothetical protein